MAVTCTFKPTPTPGCGGGPCGGAAPFDAATGAVEQSLSLLSTSHGSFDMTWYNLYQTGGSPSNPRRGLGTNWSSSQFAEIMDDGSGTIVAMFTPGRIPGQIPMSYPGSAGGNTCNTYWFEEAGSGVYEACYGSHATLTLENGLWQLTEANGRITTFDQSSGLITSQTTPGGQTTEYQHSTTLPKRVTEISRTYQSGSNTTIESRLLTYITSGVNKDAVESILLRRATQTTNPDWTDIRRVEFEYYDTDEAGKGNVGDLKIVKEQLPNSSSWVDDRVRYMRYYTASESAGNQHGLKYVISPESYDRIPDPENALESAIASHAAAYYEYDAENLVAKAVTDGGAKQTTVSFSTNPNIQNFSFNSWWRKAVITQPDGLLRTVYSNHIGQDLLVVDDDGSKRWITNNKYNADGRLEQVAHPSAVDMSNPYDEGMEDLNVNLKATGGRIDVTQYYSTTGGVGAAGYPKFRMIQNGTSNANTPIKLLQFEYDSQTINAGTAAEATAFVVAKRTEFRSDAAGGSESVDTIYGYNWHADTLLPKTVTTNLPVVAPSENGISTQTDSIVETYDIQGRMVQSEDARGTITTYSYDDATGSRIGMVQDPAGLNLATQYEVDELGRTVKVTGPIHKVDGTEVQTVNWTIFKDIDNEIWTASGYKNVKAKDSYYLMNPVSIGKLDKSGRVTDNIQATRGNAVESPGELKPSDDFTSQSSWTRWSTSIYGNGGRMTESRTYYNIPDSGEGSADMNYLATLFDYDSTGRQIMTQSPSGTITRMVYDSRGLVESTWVGLDDTGASEQDPSAGLSNDMRMVSQNQYDNDLEGGNGLVTQVTQFVSDNAVEDRITGMVYDWRDRLTTTITTDGTDEFHTSNVLDNLGRSTTIEAYRDDAVPVLIAKSETKFDSRGRVYQTVQHAVDDSGVAGNALIGNNWFDEAGNLIKSQGIGSKSFTKNVYDAIGRTISTSYSYYDGTGSDNPLNLVDNVVFTQSENEYDDASNLIRATSKQRMHNSNGYGPLNGPDNAQPKSRDSYIALWYDGVGRQTAAANYGTSSLARPSSAPASSDLILVNKTEYNPRGETELTTDPAGKVDKTEFDDAGRVTQTTANVLGNSAEQQVTETKYNSAGQMDKLIAHNVDTGNQETVYSYGVDLNGSGIASGDLLASISYPDASLTSYQYNRQGQQIQMADPRGCVEQYEFDKLGRQTARAMTVPAGVADDVLRIEMAYDNRQRLYQVTSFDASTAGNVVNQVQYTYNDFNQMIDEYQQHDGAVVPQTSPLVRYSYADGSDDHIRPESITYPDGSKVLNYDYGPLGGAGDVLNRVESLKLGADEIVTYDYLGAGQVAIQALTEPATPVQMTLATGTGNDPYDALDSFGRVTNLRWQQNSNALVDYDYAYDRASNRLAQEVNHGNVAYDEAYDYDGLHRLKLYTRGQRLGGINGQFTSFDAQNFGLDHTGNFKSFSGFNGQQQTRTHNTANEITGIQVTVGGGWDDPAYDAAGNMTTMPQPNDLSSTYDATWDAWNRLVELKDGNATVAEFEYDGLSRRIVKKSFDGGILSEPRHYFQSVQNQVLEERVDSASSADRQYVWGIRFIDDLLLRDRKVNPKRKGSTNERIYALTDTRFCVVALMNVEGVVQERFVYEPYGRSKVLDASYGDQSSSSYNWEYRYTGRELDDLTGLSYFRARYMHHELGSFISRDPLGYVDGMSLYRAYFVPSGMDPFGTLSMYDPGSLAINLGVPAIGGIQAAIAGLNVLRFVNVWNVVAVAAATAAIACLTNGLRVCVPAAVKCNGLAFRRAGTTSIGLCKPWKGDFKEAREISHSKCIARIYGKLFKPQCNRAFAGCMARCGIGGFKFPKFQKVPNGFCKDLCGNDIACSRPNPTVYG